MQDRMLKCAGDCAIVLQRKDMITKQPTHTSSELAGDNAGCGPEGAVDGDWDFGDACNFTSLDGVLTPEECDMACRAEGVDLCALDNPVSGTCWTYVPISPGGCRPGIVLAGYIRWEVCESSRAHSARICCPPGSATTGTVALLFE